MTKGSDTSFSTEYCLLHIHTIYNIQYAKHYYYIISLKFSHEDMKQKCSNKAECNNGISLKVINQTDPSIKKKRKLGHRPSTCC